MNPIDFPVSIMTPVHYVSEGSPLLPDGSQKYPSVCRGALVTEVDPDDPHHVGLYVINNIGTFHRSLDSGGSLYGHTGGHWHPLHD